MVVVEYYMKLKYVSAYVLRFVQALSRPPCAYYSRGLRGCPSTRNGMHTCILSCITNRHRQRGMPQSFTLLPCIIEDLNIHMISKHHENNVMFPSAAKTKYTIVSSVVAKRFFGVLHRSYNSYRLYPETAWYTNIRRLSERGGLRLSYF